jgi:PAS domain S-box-containing protein
MKEEAGITAQPYSIITLSELKPGDHLCILYETEQEHQELLTAYIRDGLERNQKVVYIVDSHTAEVILEYLDKTGLRTAEYLASGQLSILTAEDSYLREGRFDPGAMIDLLRREEDQALKEGYAAMRVTGEMTWVLRGQPGSERLIEYEARLNDYLPGSRALALCQYDRWCFDARILLDVIATHPIVVIGTEAYDNFYYVPHGQFLGEDDSFSMVNQRIDHLRDRKRLEQALLDNAKLYHTIFNGSSDAVFVYHLTEENLPGDFIEVNEKACKMLGYSREKLMGLNRLDLETPQGMELLKERLCALRERKRGLYETTLVTKQGRQVPVEINSNLVELDGRLVVLAIARDITERQLAEETLRLSEERFSKVFDASPLAICIAALPEGRLVDANPAYVDLTGYTRDELIGHTTIELGLVPSLERRGEMLEELSRQGGFMGFPTRLRARDGEVKELKAHVVIIELDGERCALTMLE